MKKSFILFFTQSLLILLLGIEGVAVAQDDNNFGLIFEPRVVTGMMIHKYEEKYDERDNVNWEDTIPFAGIGLTLMGQSNKNIAFDIYAQHSAHGEDSLFDETKPTRDYSINLRRQDYAANLSYGGSLKWFTEDDHLWFYLGYKINKTDISGTRRLIITPASYQNEEIQFETKGPFMGFTYSVPITSRGMVGINAALSYLSEIEYRSKWVEFDEELTYGTTIGFSWKYQMTKNWSYTFSADYYRYTMGASQGKTINAVPIDLTLSSLEENIGTIKLLLRYRFD